MFAASVASVGLVMVLLQATPRADVPPDGQRPQPAAHAGDIPLGEWSGDGVFVYQEWPADEAPELPGESDGLAEAVEALTDEEPDQAERSHAHRRYRTELSLWEERIDGRDFVMMDIRARRGRLANLGDQTHLVVALERIRRLSRAMVLYRVTAFSFNPGPDDELNLNQFAPPLSASCTTLEGATYLQIHYMDNFVDTLRFEDERVEKTGMYHTKTGLIHWSEELTRR